MKNTLIRVLALVMMVMLLLTGCANRGADKDTKVIEFADGTFVTVGDMQNVYNDMYSYYAYLYDMYYGVVPADLDEYVANKTANAYLLQEVTKRHAEEYGVSVTPEMEAEAAVSAQEEYDSYIDSYISYNLADMDEEKARKEAEKAVDKMGYTYEYMLKEHTDSLLVEAIIEKMTEDITEPSEEEIVALYNEKVASDEQSYKDNAESFENATSYGTTLYWLPEGYRAVQHILLKPTDEALLTEYTTAYEKNYALSTELVSVFTNGSEDEERTTDVITEELNAATAALKDVENRIIADCQSTLDEINAKLAEGVAFPDLIMDYTADSDSVFYVSENTTSLIEPFKNGAMALANVGDVSAPVVGEYGVHLIYYVEDVTSGPVDMENVREALTAEALQNAKDAAYDAQANIWIEESGAQLYVERWIPTEE